MHFGQCDGGETIDSPRGTRHATTFRNEATHAPAANENAAKTGYKALSNVTSSCPPCA